MHKIPTDFLLTHPSYQIQLKARLHPVMPRVRRKSGPPRALLYHFALLDSPVTPAELTVSPCRFARDRNPRDRPRWIAEDFLVLIGVTRSGPPCPEAFLNRPEMRP